ncbi:MAG: aminoglycoside phosphotransferase family protein [Anaerolineae bacterium]|nr:aminoglycoside phosphotransferase family protein [Anaerolineae bacterium]
MFANFDTVVAALLEQDTTGWEITPVHQGKYNTVYKAAVENQPPVAVKRYAERASAEREFGVLHGLREFGINLAPEPLALYPEHQLVVMGWIEGTTMTQPPATHDEELWHRVMAATGASGEMPYAPYQKLIPSQGKGCFRPADRMDEIDRLLQSLDSQHPLNERLIHLMQRVRENIVPGWNFPVKIGLCRRDPDPHNLIWDGHHLLAVDWEEADWGDMAAEIGLWNAHPAYENVPSSHWVWVRWEFGRLTHDPQLVPRATVYARLGQVWWAVYLTVQLTGRESEFPQQVQLRDRYLKRAEKLF